MHIFWEVSQPSRVSLYKHGKSTLLLLWAIFSKLRAYLKLGGDLSSKFYRNVVGTRPIAQSYHGKCNIQLQTLWKRPTTALANIQEL